ncbi:MAG: hypothetical protein OXQ84_06945, partial [bacterium]|nr:hypothetical protein [bacterium]
DSLQDLIRALDEHPEWVDELRARLLPREVLELPRILANFIAATDKRFEAIETRLDHLERGQARMQDDIALLKDGQARMQDDIALLKGGQAQLRDDVTLLKDGQAQLRDDVTLLKDGQARIQDDMALLKGGQARIREDMGLLKGGHARNVAERQAVLIVEDLGLEYVRTLNFEDITNMVRTHDTSGLGASDLRSFRLADLILEAKEQAGTTCYVAVEISFTVNGRDTRRALRNAEYLSRFTGRQAYAVVAGVHVDERIREHIAAGEVTWYRLDRNSLEVA